MKATEGEKTASDVCARVLQHGLDLVRSISDEAYGTSPKAGAMVSQEARVGAHLRHLIDYFDCLFAGIEGGDVDYAGRERCVEVELSRSAGACALERCLDVLGSQKQSDPDTPLRVRGDAGEPIFRSTLGRELSFVAGHGVHHLAMMRRLLDAQGVSVPEEVGVATSTLSHWQKVGDAKADGAGPCE